MDHKFLASPIDPLKCAKCKWPEISHGPEAVCESCPNTGVMEIHNDMLLCRECISKELEAARNSVAVAPAQSTPEMLNETLKLARQIDNSVETRSDIFNAGTISFEEIGKAIHADDSIPKDQKVFVLAKIVKERFDHYKKIFFEHNEIAVNAATQQRAAIQFLNTLANSLKESERKALQLADVSYKPEVVKVDKPKTIKIKTNASQADLNKAAKELGLESTHTLQLIMTAKQVDLAGAMAHVREMQAKAAASKVVTQ